MLTDGLFNKEVPSPSTSGNVLTSDGNNWVSQEVAAGIGAWKFLSEIVSTSSTTIDFSNAFNSTYDNYRITANNVGSNTTNVNLSASYQRASNGNYSAYDLFQRLNPSSGQSTFSYGGGGIFANNANNTGSIAQRANFTVDILNPYSTDAKWAVFTGGSYAGFASTSAAQIFTFLLTYFDSPQSGIRFQTSNGTMTGTFRLYGFSKT